jgi:hypothetical protein
MIACDFSHGKGESLFLDRNYLLWRPSLEGSFPVGRGEIINPGGDCPVYYGALDVPLSLLRMG